MDCLASMTKVQVTKVMAGETKYYIKPNQCRQRLEGTQYLKQNNLTHRHDNLLYQNTKLITELSRFLPPQRRLQPSHDSQLNW